MRFLHPFILLAIPAALLVGILSATIQRRRSKRLGLFANEAVLRASGLDAQRGAAVQSLRTWLTAAGLALLAVAAARPQWGRANFSAASRGASLLIALDVSRSMLAEDVRPNRLERAKTDIIDLVSDLKGDRAGLLVFRGKANMLCPLTTDHAFLHQAIDGISVDSAPRGETDIADAIEKALSSLETSGDDNCAIVLISDGEDLAGRATAAAEKAAKRDIPIFTVGLGAAEGAEIPAQEGGGAMKFGGQKVKTRLTESTLREIAKISGGAYIPLETSGTASTTLGAIYRQHLSKMARREYEEMLENRFVERYQLFLTPGLLLLLAAAALSRGRIAGRRKMGNREHGAHIPVAKAAMLALLAVMPLRSNAETSAKMPSMRDARSAYNEAVELYQAGDATNAAAILKPLSIRKDMPRAIELYGASEFALAGESSSTNHAERLALLEEAASAFQRVTASGGSGDSTRMERNIYRATAEIPNLREKIKLAEIESRYGKMPPDALAASMGELQRGITARLDGAPAAAAARIELLEELAGNARKIEDMGLRLRQILDEAMKNETNEEVRSAAEELTAKRESTCRDALDALENADLDEASRLSSDAEGAIFEIWKGFAEPPSAIGEAILCETNAFLAAEQPRWRFKQDNQTAFEAAAAFAARFPSWAEEYIKNRQQSAGQEASTNAPAFTEENIAKIKELLEPLMFIMLDSAKYDDTAEKRKSSASEALPILEEIRSLLPKEDSPHQNGEQQQSAQQEQQNQQNDQNDQQGEQDNQQQNRHEEQEQDEQEEISEDVEEALRRAVEREREHEAEKQKLRRSSPLPPNSRDW